MSKQHTYTVEIRWTGNRGTGTSGYRAYSRDHLITASGKAPIEASSDPAFRGDSGRYNPEELLVGSVSACHMLWYLHLCAGAGIVVTDYQDAPIGTMIENADGSGRFTRILLRPRVTLSPDADVNRAAELHADAHRFCFVANSVNFPIDCEPAMVAERRRLLIDEDGLAGSQKWLPEAARKPPATAVQLTDFTKKKKMPGSGLDQVASRISRLTVANFRAMPTIIGCVPGRNQRHQ